MNIWSLFREFTTANVTEVYSGHIFLSTTIKFECNGLQMNQIYCNILSWQKKRCPRSYLPKWVTRGGLAPYLPSPLPAVFFSLFARYCLAFFSKKNILLRSPSIFFRSPSHHSKPEAVLAVYFFVV